MHAGGNKAGEQRLACDRRKESKSLSSCNLSLLLHDGTR